MVNKKTTNATCLASSSCCGLCCCLCCLCFHLAQFLWKTVSQLSVSKVVPQCMERTLNILENYNLFFWPPHLKERKFGFHTSKNSQKSKYLTMFYTLKCASKLQLHIHSSRWNMQKTHWNDNSHRWNLPEQSLLFQVCFRSDKVLKTYLTME